jgi:hypothetical protein
MLTTATEYLRANLSVLPTIRETKMPAPIVGKWGRYQKELPAETLLEAWFGNGAGHAIALVCGAVSGNLECLDFDQAGEIYEPFMMAVKTDRPKLFRKLVIERTQSRGYHLIYRCDSPVSGNTKLAERGIRVEIPGEHPYGGKTYKARKIQGEWFIVVDLIETRGEGGYFLCAPSPGYELLRGSISDLPVITLEERNYLLGIARSLNEWVLPKVQPQTKPRMGKDFKGLSPWEDYNRKVNPLSLLIAAGWTETHGSGTTPRGGRTVLIRRPGKRHGHSGSVVEGKLFHCFTSNGAPFEPEQAYNAFQVYAMLEHGGDFTAAAKQAYRDGYGERQKQGITPQELARAINEPSAEPDCEVLTARQRIERLNLTHAGVMVGGRFYILNEIVDPIFGRPDISFSSVADFRNRYSNDLIWTETERGRKAHSVATAWLSYEKRRDFQGIVFAPGRDVPDYYNLYRGFAVEPKRGDWSLLRRHIEENICGGIGLYYQYLIDWMADLVQDPGGLKPGVALVLRGGRGTGKGLFATAFGGIFGPHFLPLTDQNHLVGRFNSHHKDALLVFADECFWAGDKGSEGILKGLITEPTIRVEQKGKDSFEIQNHIRLIVASNEEWVVPSGMDERRFFVLDVKEDHKQDIAYWGPIWEETRNGGIAAMLYDLMEVKYEKNDLRSAPKTWGLVDQIEYSMSNLETWWHDRLIEGSILRGDSGWNTGNIETDAIYSEYATFAHNLNKGSVEPKNIFVKKLKRVCGPCVSSTRCRATAMYGKRPWGLKFKPLEDCRRHHEQRLGIRAQWEDDG